MRIGDLLIFLVKLKQFSHMVVFYIINCLRFQKLEFKSLIISPQIIVGRQYISLFKGALVKERSSLFAIPSNSQKPEIIISQGCSLGYGNHIAAVKRVMIGKNVLTANNVYLSDNIHQYTDILTPVMRQPIQFKKIVEIGDGSWIGENACIIGAKIGKNCVIGANAVVNSDIPDYCVAAGIPAKVIRRYNSDSGKWDKV